MASSISSAVLQVLNTPTQNMTQPITILVGAGKSGILKVETVLDHGSGHSYQWCKRVKDDLTLSNETAEQLIFCNHSSDFEQQVDVSQLIHVLHNEHLLSTDQIDNLTLEVVGNTNARKKQRLLLWIPQSTSNFIDPFIKCLRSTNHKPHLELADDLEADLWVPLSKQNCRYDGVTSPILTLCNMKKEHEGIYRCRVINSEGISVLSEPSQVVLNKPNDEAVQVFIEDLRTNPENDVQLAKNLIGRLQEGSSVGYIALTRAIREVGECKEVVRAFLAHGWSASEKMEGGRTLIHELAEQGHTETLRMVLPTSGELCADENRCTPLHLAVKAGRVETVIKLLEFEESRCTIDYQDKDFSTALHLAVEQGSLDIVSALLTVTNINLGILNKNNLKAIEVARKKEHHFIVRKIQEREQSQMLVLSPLSPVTTRIIESYRTWSASSGYASSAGGQSMRQGSLPRTESCQQLLDTPQREIFNLQKRLVKYDGTLTGKRLLNHGVLRKCNRKGAKSDVTIFVLTDVILYTTYSEFTQKYTVKEELSIRGMEVLDMQESDQPAVRNEPLSFTVTSKERALHLVARTQEEKEDWIQCLQSAVESLHQQQNHHTSMPNLPDGAGMGSRAPIWVLDTHVTACQLSDCNKKFTFLDRKHHCRQCGKVVCSKCSSQKRYLLYMKREGRVCNGCVEAFGGIDKSVASETQPKEPEKIVIADYVTRHQRGRDETKWYRLDRDGVLYIYGAHKDNLPTHSITLMAYTVQGDLGNHKISLTHHQAKEELFESFTVPASTYDKWYNELQTMIECLSSRKI